MKTLFVLVASVLLVLAACAKPSQEVPPVDNPVDNGIQDEEVQEPPENGIYMANETETGSRLATAWMRNNALTYLRDGSDLKVEDVEVLPCEECWEVTVSFEAGEGYGSTSTNESNRVEHVTTLSILEGVITSAVTDEVYDEFRDKSLEPDIILDVPREELSLNHTRGEARRIAEDWVRDESETYIFGGYDLEFRDVWSAPCENCWNVVFKFKSVSDRYGGSVEEEFYRDPDTGRLYDPDDLSDDLRFDDEKEELYRDFRNIDVHTMSVLVDNGVVTRGIVDGIYNEMEHDFVDYTDDDDNLTRDKDAERAIDVAEAAIQSMAETFRHDGYNLRLEYAREDSGCEDCYVIAFLYNSKYAGYGDRSGQKLAQRLTRHITVVRVEDFEVEWMVTDNIYDELEQEFI